MSRQPRRIDPRNGSSVLGNEALVQSFLSDASVAVIPYGVRCRMTGQRGPPHPGRNTKVLRQLSSRIGTMACKAPAPLRSSTICMNAQSRLRVRGGKQSQHSEDHRDLGGADTDNPLDEFGPYLGQIGLGGSSQFSQVQLELVSQ